MQIYDQLDVDWQDPINSDSEFARGLVGWWLPGSDGFGSKTTYDLTRYGNNAVATGTLPWENTARPGGFGSLNYSGTSFYSDVGTGVWNSTGPVTFAFWNLANSGAQNGFGGHGTDGNQDRLQAHAPFTDSNLYWDYGNIGGGGRVSVDYSSYEDVWTHVILTSEGAGGSGMAIYLNGNQVATSGSSDGPSGAIDFSIGAFIRTTGSDFFHSGSLDDIRLYDYSVDESMAWAMYHDSLNGCADLLNRISFPVAFADQGGGFQSAWAANSNVIMCPGVANA